MALEGLGGYCTDLIKNSAPAILAWSMERLRSWVTSSRGKSKTEAQVFDFDNISDFWRDVKREQLEHGNLVSIQGQLSLFAPLLIAAPRVKRNLHLRYRKELQKSQIKEREKAELNARLAYTAGQMIWRLALERNPLMYLGLYHSIVRNSIPVFVDNEYFHKHMERIFRKSSNPYIIEARIRGVVVDFAELEEDITHENMFKGFIQPRIFREEGSAHGIIVDGEDTCIEYVDEARYLDGDIWVAVEDKNGQQSFVSRFVDLSDLADFKEERENLIKDVDEEHPEERMVFQFDQVDKLYPKFKSSTIEDVLKCR